MFGFVETRSACTSHATKANAGEEEGRSGCQEEPMCLDSSGCMVVRINCCSACVLRAVPHIGEEPIMIEDSPRKPALRRRHSSKGPDHDPDNEECKLPLEPAIPISVCISTALHQETQLWTNTTPSNKGSPSTGKKSAASVSPSGKSILKRAAAKVHVSKVTGCIWT